MIGHRILLSANESHVNKRNYTKCKDKCELGKTASIFHLLLLVKRQIWKHIAKARYDQLKENLGRKIVTLVFVN